MQATDGSWKYTTTASDIVNIHASFVSTVKLRNGYREMAIYD